MSVTLWSVKNRGVDTYTQKMVVETEPIIQRNDLSRFNTHLKRVVGLERRKADAERFIMDENSRQLRNRNDILDQWVSFY